ncbi:MAG TPA: hypothetical protein DDY32_19165 [Desulfobulbaceae bacterium]|nr:hypothetical protein [Desulfobulbaceae bacterium]
MHKQQIGCSRGLAFYPDIETVNLKYIIERIAYAIKRFSAYCRKNGIESAKTEGDASRRYGVLKCRKPEQPAKMIAV